MRRPLRVVYVIGYYGDLTGSQRSLLALLRSIPSEQVTPLVVFPGEGRCSAAYRDAGLRVEVLPAPAGLDRFGRVIPESPWRTKAQLAVTDLAPWSLRFGRLLQRHGADVAHFNDTRALLMGGPGAAWTRRPRVWHVRGDESSLGWPWQVASGLATRIVCVADAVRACVPRWAQHRCRTIHNGIDAALPLVVRDRATLLGALPSPLAPRADDILVLMVGSLVPFKGAHHLLDAISLLESRAPALARRICLVLAGDAPHLTYRRLLEERAAQLSVARVRFAGWDTAPLDWMRAADVLVHPTVARETLSLAGTSLDVHGTEGFPRTVLEAMACGTTIVATRVMGVPEQVEDGVEGILCPPSLAGELSSAIERAISLSPEARAGMGAAARARVASRFSDLAAATAMLALYRELRSTLREPSG